MKYLLILTIIVASIASADELRYTCDVKKSAVIDLKHYLGLYKVHVSIEGKSCYEAELSISISSNTETLYHYKIPFGPLVAIAWGEDVSSKNAHKYAKKLLDGFNICSSLLPAKLDAMDGWEWNSLKVPPIEYSLYHSSDCTTFTHPIHYEAFRVIVFPGQDSKGVIVSEYGL